MLAGSVALAVVAIAGMAAAHAQVAGDESLLISPLSDNDAKALAAYIEADGVAAAATAWAASDAYTRADTSPSVARTVSEYEHAAGDLYAEASDVGMKSAAEWAAADHVHDEYSAVTSAYRLELTAAFAYERAATAAAKWSTSADGSESDDAMSAERAATAAAMLSRERMAEVGDALRVIRASNNIFGEMLDYSDWAEAAARAEVAERVEVAERAVALVAAGGSAEQLAAAERAMSAERSAAWAVDETMGFMSVATDQVLLADQLNTKVLPALAAGDWDRARSVYEAISMSGSDAIAQMAAGAAMLRDAARYYDQAVVEWAAAGDSDQAAAAAEQSVRMAEYVDVALGSMTTIEQVTGELDSWFRGLEAGATRQ